jgi:hypothetical protein
MKMVLNVGLDIHGAIDRNPELFRLITHELRAHGVIIHILTGHYFSEVREKLKKWGIEWDHEYSILDYHKGMGTEIVHGVDGEWISEELWNRGKGEYAKRVGLDVHFDNDLVYGEFFPDGCHFIHISDDEDLSKVMGECIERMLREVKE